MTLKEIAERAGVSTATVSYVLNGSDKVSEATRERVRKIIEETGYRSNFLAKSLRSGRTKLIGVLVEDAKVRNVAEIIDGISATAECLGYQTMLGNLRLLTKIGREMGKITDFQQEIDRVMETFSAMRVDGVIYVGMHDRKIPHILKNNDIPVVYCYCYTTRDGISVGYDNSGAASDIAKLFLAAGHTDVAVMAGREDSEPSQKRLAGIREAFSEAELELPEERIFWGNWSYECARSIAEGILKGEDRPTAIIALNDEMAIGIRDAAHALQLRIPEDLSLSGFDNDDVIRYALPHITTVERPLTKMGARALELLVERLGKTESEAINVVMPCSIVEGQSIGRPCR